MDLDKEEEEKATHGSLLISSETEVSPIHDTRS